MRVVIVIMVLMIVSGAYAQSINSSKDAFSAGKEFAADGSMKAGAAISQNSGERNVPKYNSNAEEGSFYQGGKGLLPGFGTTKVSSCSQFQANNAYEQQECDAINFLAKNHQNRPKFEIDKNKDPLVVGSSKIINNPGTIRGGTKQDCHVVEKTAPSTYRYETCTSAVGIEDTKCKRKLVIAVKGDACVPGTIIGKVTGNGRQNSDGVFPTAWLTCVGGNQYRVESYEDAHKVDPKFPNQSCYPGQAIVKNSALVTANMGKVGVHKLQPCIPGWEKELWGATDGMYDIGFLTSVDCENGTCNWKLRFTNWGANHFYMLFETEFNIQFSTLGIASEEWVSDCGILEERAK